MRYPAILLGCLVGAVSVGGVLECEAVCSNYSTPGRSCTGGLCLVKEPGYSSRTVPKGVAGAQRLHNTQDQFCCRGKGKAEPRIVKKCLQYATFDHTVEGAPLVVWLDFLVERISLVDEAEDHYTANMWLQLTWLDPQLTLCRCDQVERQEEAYTVSWVGNDRVWLPDLHIWEARTFARKYGFGGRRKVERVKLRKDNDNRVLVTQDINFEAELACHFNTSFFPFERNKCMVRFGSYSKDASQVMFQQNSRHLPGRLHHLEFQLQLFPLPAKDRLVEMQTATGEKSFIYDGFQMIVDRGEGRVWRILLPYGLPILILVIVSLAGIFLMSGHPVHRIGVDRAPLFSITLLGMVMIFVDATNFTPMGFEPTASPLITFIKGSIGAILGCFVGLCLIIRAVSDGFIANSDPLEFILLCGIGVSYLVWVINHYVASKDWADIQIPCHNMVH